MITTDAQMTFIGLRMDGFVDEFPQFTNNFAKWSAKFFART